MQTKFIIFIVLVVLVVGGLGLYFNRQANAPSKYDGFAQALTTSGAKFYGAFWCPHCQAQKALFGTAVKYLPYVECSNADQSQTQICIDKKIESYPTWTFANGIKVTSTSTPTICPIGKTGVEGLGLCTNRDSLYERVWLFTEYPFSIASSIDPIKTGNDWQFPVDAEARGEIPLTDLAAQIQFTLPQ